MRNAKSRTDFPPPPFLFFFVAVVVLSLRSESGRAAAAAGAATSFASPPHRRRRASSSPTAPTPPRESPTALNVRGADDVGGADRRTALLRSVAVAAVVGNVPFLRPTTTPPVAVAVAAAANLPESTGADPTRTGTIESLVPILSVRQSFRDARTVLSSSPPSSLATPDAISALSETLKSLPTDEIKFKRLFDSYSDPVSYKQKFMDNNAFLVYYTRGFDGPGRPSMEEGDAPRQTRQYGARNDAWAAYDDLLAELRFARSGGGGEETVVGDLVGPLDRVLIALDEYLSLVSPDDLREATSLLMR